MVCLVMVVTVALKGMLLFVVVERICRYNCTITEYKFVVCFVKLVSKLMIQTDSAFYHVRFGDLFRNVLILCILRIDVQFHSVVVVDINS